MVHDHEALLAIIVACCAKKKKRKKRSRIWCKPWLERRASFGSCSQIFSELQSEDSTDFENYTRLPISGFIWLLNRVSESIKKQDTVMRRSISPAARLEATLIFLASGSPYNRLRFGTRVSTPSFSYIVPETCQAIYEALKDEFLKMPTSQGEWKKVSEEFERKWSFPHCVGSIDGKHIQISPPPNSGSYYYNYKGSHSIVLMAVVDANYEFLYVDVGRNGRCSDGGVWGNCSLATLLSRDHENLLPAPETLPNSEKILPYVFVADDAFPLKSYIMKPFPFRHQTAHQRIFSYRLSRARRTVENAFGILSNRFRIFLSCIRLAPEKVETIVLCATALHNFLRRTYPSEHGEYNATSAPLAATLTTQCSRRDHLIPIEAIQRRPTHEAKRVREEYMKYFVHDDPLPWQNELANVNDMQ